MHAQFFISGTNTDVGKTFVTRGLSSALLGRGVDVSAFKPIETGVVNGHAQDATQLATACGKPALANAPGFYRTVSPVAPLTAEKMQEAPPLDLAPLAKRCEALAAEAQISLCEAAGGILVPLNQSQDIADFARALDWPVILVASDTLGVLSQSLCAAAATINRGLNLVAVVLNRFCPPDPSRAFNQSILSERLSCPVLVFEKTDDDNEALAKQANQSGLTDLCLTHSKEF